MSTFSGGSSALAFPESSITSSSTTGNTIGGSISDDNSLEASTGTSITETLQKHGQKMEPISILVVFRLLKQNQRAGLHILESK